MDIKSYDDILKLHTWFATQVTKGLEARFRKLPHTAAALIGAEGQPAPSQKAKKSKRATKHK